MSWSNRKLHFIGIGGAGMSGLALIAARLGAVVTGSDRSASSYTERLTAAGIAVAYGHDAQNVPSGAEVIVSTAIADDNPELAAARTAGVAIRHRSDLLSELAGQKRCIAVAGTHGKTTTTAMIAHVLHESGVAPSFFVGGEVMVGGETTNAAWGDGEWVVVEADESDRSFLKLTPETAIVTNVELDHHATYGGGFDELIAAFGEFVTGATTIVVWRGQASLASLAADEASVGFDIDRGEDRPHGAASIGVADLVAENIVTPDREPAAGTTYTLRGTGPVELGVRGEHNVLNSLAAIAAAERAGVPRDRAAAALKSFKGVARRFEPLGVSAGGARVYDDYAHHPTEVEAALRTARQTAAGGRVVAVFQPHLFSRTKSLAREFGQALALADVVVVMAVYSAREDAADFPGVSGWTVAAAAYDAAPGKRIVWAPGHEDAANALERELRDGDLLITIGAGDVSSLAHSLAGRR